MGSFQSRKHKSIRNKTLNHASSSNAFPQKLPRREIPLINQIWSSPNRIFTSTSRNMLNLWSECNPRYYHIVSSQEDNDHQDHIYLIRCMQPITIKEVDSVVDSPASDYGITTRSTEELHKSFKWRLRPKKYKNLASPFRYSLNSQSSTSSGIGIKDAVDRKHESIVSRDENDNVMDLSTCNSVGCHRSGQIYDL